MVAVGSGPRRWRWKIDGGHDPLITELEGSFFFGKEIGLVPADREQRWREEELVFVFFLVFFLRLLAGWVGWIRSYPMWGRVW